MEDRVELEKRKKRYLKRIESIEKSISRMWNHEVGFWRKQIQAYKHEIKSIDKILEGED